jgi:uncharacterized membrane protein YfcA
MTVDPHGGASTFCAAALPACSQPKDFACASGIAHHPREGARLPSLPGAPPRLEQSALFSLGTIILLLVIGALIGLLSGLLGMGGGSLMIPALVLVFDSTGLDADLSTRMAFGTNLLVGMTTALAGFMVHRRYEERLWGIVLPLAGASVLGALAGSTVASHLPGALLRVLFGAAVALVGINLLLRREVTREGLPRFSSAVLIPLGLLIGFAASLVGLGGAVFTTIILVALLRYPMQHIVAISTFVQTAGAFAACLGYMLNGLRVAGLPPFSLGYVNLLAAGAMILTGIPLATVGARLTHRTPSPVLRRIFGALLLAIAAAMVWSGAR